MGEMFNSELKRIEALKYNEKRFSGMLDDMATAFLSAHEFNGTDKALTAVRTAKKALRSKGLNQDIINDYFLQRSYLSKTQLRQFVNESIFNDDGGINPVVESIRQKSDKLPVNDLIIEELKSRPELIRALKKGVKKSGLQEIYKVKAPTALINFYQEHKDIINM